MDEAHDHSALADRGGATLNRPGADVARRGDAGHTRLDEDALGAGPLAGEHEAWASGVDLNRRGRHPTASDD